MRADVLIMLPLMTLFIDHCMQLMFIHAWNPQGFIGMMGDDLMEHLSSPGRVANASYGMQLFQTLMLLLIIQTVAMGAGELALQVEQLKHSEY